MSTLAERLLAIHHRLDRASVAHAFGGAIALAYCTEEPRGTRDIDVNVFVGPEHVERVLAGLPDGIEHGPSDAEIIRRDGQTRLWWDDTPVDLFFDVHDFHHHVPLGVRDVAFSGATIPVLGCSELAVFKVLFDRTRDWADIEAMAEAGSLDATFVLGWVVRLLGPQAKGLIRLAALLGSAD